MMSAMESMVRARAARQKTQKKRTRDRKAPWRDSFDSPPLRDLARFFGIQRRSRSLQLRHIDPLIGPVARAGAGSALCVSKGDADGEHSSTNNLHAVCSVVCHQQKAGLSVFR